MRLLYVSHRVPYPPDKGERIRAYYLLRFLARRHEVRLLTAARDHKERDRASKLLQLGLEVEVVPLRRFALLARCFAAPWRGQPLTLAYYDDRRLARRAAAARCEAVIAYTLAAAAPASARAAPGVLDMVDADSAKWAQYARSGVAPWRRSFAALEARRLRRWETLLARRFGQVVVSTAAEAASLDIDNAEVVPNGIDAASFALPEPPWERDPSPRLVFCGQMDYQPNVDAIVHFVEAVWPGLRRSCPRLELDVVGRSPARSVRRLARPTEIAVSGEVADVRPLLSRAWLFVAPLRLGRGVPNKVLEAMALGLPVVCSASAFTGLAEGGFEPGRHLLVARDDAEFERHVTLLLGDASLRARMGVEGRARALARYSWEASGELLEATITRAIADRATRR